MTTRTEPEITWTLPMAQANIVLAIMAKQPFEQVADLIMELRNQAQQQIQQIQQQSEGHRGNGAAVPS